MAAKTFTVTYEGTTDSSQNQAGAVEIDGKTLPEGEAVSGLSAEQVKRLDDLAYHKFTFKEGKEAEG
jgi:hypothetical protein